MSMPIGFASKVSFSSMRRRWVRTVLALFPCVLLIAVLFVGATIPNGVVNEVDEKILSSAETRQELVHLDPYFFTEPSAGFSSTPSNSYNQKRYDIATKAAQVKEVYPQYGNLQLYAPKLGNLENLSLTMLGNNQEFAKLYTGENFTYTEGEPVPVLLNGNAISSELYKFDGSGKISGDYNNPKSFDGKISYQTLKDSDKLVGKTVTMNANQFSVDPGVIENYSASGSTVEFAKVTKADKALILQNQTEKFGKYWDINQLKKPLNIEFKIVGIIRGGSSAAGQAYIPNEAAVDLFNQQYQLQKKARTNVVVPTDFYGSQEVKAELKDGKLINAAYGYSPPQYKVGKMPEESLSTVLLPTVVSGLVAEQVKLTSGQGYKEPTLTVVTKKQFYPAGAVVRLATADDRKPYLEYLKQNGMELYDDSPLSVIRNIRKWANTIVTWLTIILGSIAALILLTTMGRFVADSRREIGVWRAIGATKLDIKKLVWVRMGWLLVIAIGVGILAGLIASYFIAGMIAGNINEASAAFDPYASQNFVASIVVSFLGGEVPSFSKLGLMATDWYLLLTRLALLSFISLFLCLLPARKASRISPVIAIRDNE